MCSSKCLYPGSSIPPFCSHTGSGHIQGQPVCPYCKYTKDAQGFVICVITMPFLFVFLVFNVVGA